jgi:hypothetical protein
MLLVCEIKIVYLRRIFLVGHFLSDNCCCDSMVLLLCQLAYDRYDNTTAI